MEKEHFDTNLLRKSYYIASTCYRLIFSKLFIKQESVSIQVQALVSEDTQHIHCLLVVFELLKC